MQSKRDPNIRQNRSAYLLVLRLIPWSLTRQINHEKLLITLPTPKAGRRWKPRLPSKEVMVHLEVPKYLQLLVDRFGLSILKFTTWILKRPLNTILLVRVYTTMQPLSPLKEEISIATYINKYTLSCIAVWARHTGNLRTWVQHQTSFSTQ